MTYGKLWRDEDPLRSASASCSSQGRPGDRPGCAACPFFGAFPKPSQSFLQARVTDKYFQWVQSNGLGALATSWKKDAGDCVRDYGVRCMGGLQRFCVYCDSWSYNGSALTEQIQQAVPSSASELLGQMMQTDPERRPATRRDIAVLPP